MRPWAEVLLGSLLAGLVPLAVSPAQTVPPESFEHDVKASFIYTVARFVEWPEEAFSAPNAPLVFAVYADDPLEESLLRTVDGKSVRGHPLVVERVRDERAVGPCHVLYVGKSGEDRLPGVLEGLRGGSVLTVGEIDRFAQRGGVMRLIFDENMVRFEVNVDAAGRAGLQISSKILKLGRVVHDKRRIAGSP